MRVSLRGANALISIALLSATYVRSQGCGATSQNPHCDPSFANLICCPYPSVCYWQNRQGTPGCCGAGQVCGVNGVVTPQPVSTLVATQGTQPTATTTVGNGGVVETVTSGAVGVVTTVTSGAVGVFSTVTTKAGGPFATVSGILVGQGVPHADLDWSVLVLPIILTLWTMAGAAGVYYR